MLSEWLVEGVDSKTPGAYNVKGREKEISNRNPEIVTDIEPCDFSTGQIRERARQQLSDFYHYIDQRIWDL